ncbi:heavy metal translocating P-type ATPase [Labrys neptuniae]
MQAHNDIATASAPAMRYNGSHLLSVLLAAIPALALASGLCAFWLGHEQSARLLWLGGTVPVLAMLVLTIVQSLARGAFGLDIIAALAMAGAIWGGELLAGVVVALMFAGGQALEMFAQNRASSAMTALLSRVAHSAQLYQAGRVVTVPITSLSPGDRILVRPGEVLPADGVLMGEQATLDESALTGESMPVHRVAGQLLPSGIVNAGPAFDLQVSKSAQDSTYAAIVRLVEGARRSKAPMARMADRYGIAFLLLTLALAGLAWWIAQSPHRALAVLVIATPCPLILAVPVALVAGMSRCAKRGVMVKTAGSLETLATIRTVLLDKTGTLTRGEPTLARVEPKTPFSDDEFLRLAGSIGQASHHVMAQALVEEARRRGLDLVAPKDAWERAGAGVEGVVEEHRLKIGRADFVDPVAGSQELTGIPKGQAALHVSLDGHHIGRILFKDELRPDAYSTLQALRAGGIERIALITGDRRDIALDIARPLALDAVVGDATPEDKARVVRSERQNAPTMMIGDGINDAPALASADVGAALGARGAVAASQAADVIVLVDNLDRIAEALVIARRTRAIALQSMLIGMGLSLAGMVTAVLGHLDPVTGALLQEAIDLAVVLNALRALRPAAAQRVVRAR